MASAPTTNVTQLLLDWRAGKQEALDTLMSVVYEELRRLASRVDMKVSWQDRAHFFAVAARLMRRLLVDHARAHHRAKREGNGQKVSLDDAAEVSYKPASNLVALDEALTQFATFDERKSEIVERHYFGGLSNDPVAEALGISRATVQRELRLAKAWLNRELKREG